MTRFVLIRALILSAVSLTSGCLSLVVPNHEPATTDDATVKLMLERRDFMGTGFLKVNHAAYASDLETDRIVSLYVSADAAAAYEAVTPDTDSAGPEFPVGGMVVRTSSDASGNLLNLTFMVKHEPGYFPEVGDFAFGVTDANGAPVDDDGGTPVWGKVEDCATCHETRASSGFLFGVPLARR